MKLRLLIVALGCYGWSLAQGTVIWGPEIPVADGSVYGNMYPRATVVGDTPVVVYGNGATEELFVSRWNGSGFDTQPILPPGTSAYFTNWTGPDIASVEDTVIAVFKMNPVDTGNVYIVRSTDGGVTFSDTIRANNYTGGNAWMPSLEMRPDGNPVVSMMIHDGTWSNPRYVLAHSTDGGLTFGNVEEVASSIPGEACDCCPSEVVIDGARELLLFRNNEMNIRDVYGVLSTDGGQTFPYAENLDQLNWNVSSCPSSNMDGVFMNDDLYTVFASAAEGIYRVYVSKTNVSSGLSLDSVEVMTAPIPASGIQNYPRISGENDTIVMVWEERINFNKEIYYSVAVPGVDVVHALTTYKFQGNQTITANQTNPEVVYKNGYVHLFYTETGSGDLMYRRGQVDVALGTAENFSATVRMYPNPSATGSGVVQGAKEITGVTSLTGKQLDFSQNASDVGVGIQLETTAPGVYFLHGTGTDGSQFCIRWVIN